MNTRPLLPDDWGLRSRWPPRHHLGQQRQYHVGVLLGTGTGTFGAATYYPVGADSIFANVGDINGDDRVDISAVTSTGLSVLLSGQSETASISNVAFYGCSTQSVTATYGGDGNYGTSTSSALTFTASERENRSGSQRQPGERRCRTAGHPAGHALSLQLWHHHNEWRDSHLYEQWGFTWQCDPLRRCSNPERDASCWRRRLQGGLRR